MTDMFDINLLFELCKAVLKRLVAYAAIEIVIIITYITYIHPLDGVSSI